jgi:hypothetical protein
MLRRRPYTHVKDLRQGTGRLRVKTCKETSLGAKKWLNDFKYLRLILKSDIINYTKNCLYAEV